MDTLSPFQEIPDERSWIRKHGITIISISLGGILGLATIYVVSKLGTSTMGFNLSMISILFLTLGIICILTSQIEERKLDIIWEEHTVLSKNVNYPFTINQNKCIAFAVINPEKGDTDFKIREFESSISTKIEPRILYQTSITNGDAFQTPFIELPIGVYHLSFKGDKNIKFSFGYVFSEKPNSQFFSFGLTMLEVSIPLLITGLLVQIFNVFI